MIRKCPLFLFIFLFAAVVNGQTDFHFADSTAQWNILGFGFTGVGCCTGDSALYNYSTRIYKVNGDTSVNSVQYQKIQSGDSTIALVRRDSSDRIFARLLPYDTSDYLLYSFDVQVGDTVQLYYQPFAAQPPAIVTRVDTVYMSQARKRVVLWAGYEPNAPGDTMAYIDGIGSLNWFFLQPHFSWLCDCSYETLCYYQNDTVVYHDTTYSICVLDTQFLVTGINNAIITSGKVYPNPAAENYIIVQLSQSPSKPENFELFDITGRVILQKPLGNQSNQIDLDNISPGIYLYSITSQQEQIGTGKLIVE